MTEEEAVGADDHIEDEPVRVTIAYAPRTTIDAMARITEATQKGSVTS